jgi:hypothetical protein
MYVVCFLAGIGGVCFCPLVCVWRERDAYLNVDCFILFGDGFVGSRIGLEKNGEEE